MYLIQLLDNAENPGGCSVELQVSSQTPSVCVGKQSRIDSWD